MNSTVLVDTSAYHKIKLGERGVNYAMRVVQTEWGYRCEGYALCNGIKIAEWNYEAVDFAEAVSEQTKDYLYREMRPMVVTALRGLYQVAVANEIVGA